MWPRNALPAESVKNAVTAEIEARSDKMQKILLSVDSPAPKAEAVAGSKPPKTEITAEEKTETAPPVEPTFAPHQNPLRPPTNQSQAIKPSLTVSNISGFRASDGLWVTEAGVLEFL